MGGRSRAKTNNNATKANNVNADKAVVTSIDLNNVAVDNSIKVGVEEETFTKTLTGVSSTMKELNSESMQAAKEIAMNSNAAIATVAMELGNQSAEVQTASSNKLSSSINASNAALSSQMNKNMVSSVALIIGVGAIFFILSNLKKRRR